MVISGRCVMQEAGILELKYIQAIVKETLRLHPVVPLLVPHQNITSAKAFGYDVPAKTRVFVNVWNKGRDPDIIWRKHLEFMPERFS
jgi:cytochrome P450